MNLTQLQHFVTTVKLGSYAAAGKELFVSAPAVARSVKKLEQEYRVSLMAKSGTRATPTPFGQVFFEKSEEVLSAVTALEASAEAEAHYQERAEPLCIAAVGSPFRGTVVPQSAFQAFERAHPDHPLSVARGPSGVCLAAVEDGCADAGIVLGRVDRGGMLSLRLFSIDLVVVLSKQNPLAAQKALSLGDLAGLDVANPNDLRYCRPLIHGAFRKHETEPRYVDVMPSYEHHKKFLEEEGVFFAFPGPAISALYPDALFLPMHDEDLSIPVYLVYDARRSCMGLDALKKHLSGFFARGQISV